MPAEAASRLGHLQVLQSELVNILYKQFEQPLEVIAPPAVNWDPLPPFGTPLRIIFGVDGSIQTIRDDHPPARELSFVKTALLRLDPVAMAKLNPRAPHPFAIRDLMEDAAIYHATVFPLKNVFLPNQSLRDTVRRVIFDSFSDASLQGEVLTTLRWLAYEEWKTPPTPLPKFECPHCGELAATLPTGALMGACPNCGGELFLSDWLGFHLDMGDDSAPEAVASAYMLIHETLLMFTAIRYFWNNARDQLVDCLFVKDGPLALRSQYSKLVSPIRRFLQDARSQGCDVHIVGQEKSGIFFDHLSLIAPNAPVPSVLVPSSTYVNRDIRRTPPQPTPYGQATNYGAKMFIKFTDTDSMVLSIPTGKYVADPTIADLIGINRILATLPGLIGHLYESSLLPIERAHAIASLSTYPSATVLRLFAERS